MKTWGDIKEQLGKVGVLKIEQTRKYGRLYFDCNYIDNFNKAAKVLREAGYNVWTNLPMLYIEVEFKEENNGTR